MPPRRSRARQQRPGLNAGDVPPPAPAILFRIQLKQPPASLRHKMSVPELCRNFSSNANPPFWIPIHIFNPERPTECTFYNVKADSPRDSVQFIEWSPRSCPRALLVANFHGRTTILTQPAAGPVNLVRGSSHWQCEHEWRQDIVVVTKWLSPNSWFPSNSSSYLETIFKKFNSKQAQISEKWPNFLCVCSVLSSGSVQLHWAQFPPTQGASSKWFSTSKGLLGAGPSGIMAADVIVSESGNMYVAGVPLVNPSTVVVWEVMPGSGNDFQVTTNNISRFSGSSVPPPLSSPSWKKFAPLAAYLFNLQDYFISEEKQGKKLTEHEISEAASLHCSPVSNFSAATTTCGSGITGVAFDPTRGGSVITIVIVEGEYMSPYDLDKGPTIRGWRVQRWESFRQPVVLHPIFANPASRLSGQPPMQTVWLNKVNKIIPPTDNFRNPNFASAVPEIPVERNSSECSVETTNILSFDPYDLTNDVRQLAQIVYSSHGEEVVVAFLMGGVHIFSGANFDPVDSYHVNVGSTIAKPAFSSNGCCLASVWHDTKKDMTILKLIRVLPPAIVGLQTIINSAAWEGAIADRFWWSFLVGIDWWDCVGCTQSAAKDGIVSLNNVIAVLDADFHALPTVQHRQQHGPNLDRIKCRLLEGTDAQDIRALVSDMQARLLLDMLGKGIESALVNPATLLPEPWQASSETLSGIDADNMVVEQALVPSLQAYVDTVLDLASYFITQLCCNSSFFQTLASHAVGASSGADGARNVVASPSNSSASPSASQGAQSVSASSSVSSQMQPWVQGAIPKISNNTDGGSSTIQSQVSGPLSFMAGTPAVRLILDCHFIHRLCQLLLFCLIFRRRQSPHPVGNMQKNHDSGLQKIQSVSNEKVEESNSTMVRTLGVAKSEEGQAVQSGQVLGVKALEEGPTGKSARLGSGNAGQGYTLEEVKVLFLIFVDLCRRTATLQHLLPVSQVGVRNVIIQLHYIDGNYTVLPEVVEASLGPYMQNMPRPRGADAAGLLLRELELHPPAEEWHRRNMFGGPWSDPQDIGPLGNIQRSKLGDSSLSSVDGYVDHSVSQGLWPRKRRSSESDAAFGLKTSLGLGSFLGIMGSRRDVITAEWKTGLDGVWYKCIRCLRQTCAFAQPGSAPTNEREAWWISQWAHGCPMCGGSWVRVV